MKSRWGAGAWWTMVPTAGATGGCGGLATSEPCWTATAQHSPVELSVRGQIVSSITHRLCHATIKTVAVSRDEARLGP